jgi:hypothetical protein
MRKALALLLSLLLSLLLRAPAFAGCGTACYPGEEQIGLWPNVMADLVAQPATTAGTYFDQDTQSYGWKTTAAPTLTPAPVGGFPYPAWTFDGTTAKNIQANFNDASGAQQWPITGDFSLVIVADLNASTPTTGTTNYVLAGSGLTSTFGWVLASNQRKLVFCYTSQTTCTVLSAALSTGTPQVIVFTWSSVDQFAAVSVDGGDFTTVSLSGAIQSATSTDSTLWLGASASATYTSPWWGNLFRALLFKESLQNSAKAAQLSYLQAIFAAKY